MPVKKKVFSADKKLEVLVNQVFRSRFMVTFKKDVNVFVLDPTTYALEVYGEDELKYSTIDRTAPMAKWMISVAEAIDQHP